MNKRQKSVIIEFIVVIVITAIVVITMLNFKDWVNRSEAIVAMRSLSEKVLQYRKARSSVPPESWIDMQKEDLPGSARLGQVHYRGLWMDLESGPDEILAYTEKNYRSPILGKGYVVLRLDGRVEWMKKGEFEILLAAQQKRAELEMMQRRYPDSQKPDQSLWNTR